MDGKGRDGSGNLDSTHYPFCPRFSSISIPQILIKSVNEPCFPNSWVSRAMEQKMGDQVRLTLHELLLWLWNEYWQGWYVTSSRRSSKLFKSNLASPHNLGCLQPEKEGPCLPIIPIMSSTLSHRTQLI